MSPWTSNELSKIGNAEELRIAALRRDNTLRKKVTIWIVPVSDDLYVRSVNGREGAWFRGALTRDMKVISGLAAWRKMLLSLKKVTQQSMTKLMKLIFPNTVVTYSMPL